MNESDSAGNPSKPLTARQTRFAEHVAAGLPPQTAYLASGYERRWVKSAPYRLLARSDVKGYVQRLADKALPKVMKADVALATLRPDKGEGLNIPPSLIEGAKTRLYDRSSLGPVIRKSEVDQRSLSIGAHVEISPEVRRTILRALGLPADAESE